MLTAHLHMMTQRLSHPYHALPFTLLTNQINPLYQTLNRYLVPGLALTRVCESTPKLPHPGNKFEIVPDSWWKIFKIQKTYLMHIILVS